ncbi:DEAD/DEAH box helicase [bacterium SCSIO 12741]|nr:DEAD/DEAH box helicase [bacterium SCSIO 12741]
MKFDDFDLSEPLKDAIFYMGFEKATPIQEQAIPSIIEGKDLIGCAQTGTGKTAAFLIPLLEKISKSEKKGIKALILVPTRELAMQIDEQVDALGYFADVSSVPVYGGGVGDVFARQKMAIQQGVDIIIATPGRFLAHHNLGYLNLDDLETLILDEADRMLDMGFIDDIQRIINLCPQEGRQTLLFSATMATEIRVLAKKIQKNPVQVNLAIAKPAANAVQKIYLVNDEHKIALLEHLLDNEAEEISNMIIFASTKEGVDKIYRKLNRGNRSIQNLHSGKSQDERNEALRKFKAGSLKILVATDVLSRGIDIEGLSHVVNYDMPNDPADYVHRVGRTARADRSGIAISFVNRDDQFKLLNVEELIERSLDKLTIPESIGTSPEYNPDELLKRKRKGRGKSRYRQGGGNRRKGGGQNRNSNNRNKGGKNFRGQKKNNDQSNRSGKKPQGKRPPGKGNNSQKGSGNSGQGKS